MYRLASHCWERGGLISVDTDGVTSTVPFETEWLNRGIGEKLGEWKLAEYGGILYAQSGVYWLQDGSGKWTEQKTRGIKRGSVSIDEALAAYEGDWIITKTQTKFVGFKETLSQGHGMARSCRWIEREVHTKIGGDASTKAAHFYKTCKTCREETPGELHYVKHNSPVELMSYPHKLPWLEDNLAELEEDLIVRVEDETDNL
jgi:hypothetical protein